MINPFDGSLTIQVSLEKKIIEELKERKDGLFKITFLVEDGEIKKGVALQWSNHKSHEDMLREMPIGSLGSKEFNNALFAFSDGFKDQPELIELLGDKHE